VRKVDGLRLILVYFYVSALTPRLNNMEISLHLYENITLFAGWMLKVKITLRLEVYNQSVRLGVKPLETPLVLLI
jgi:hypothetical protein